MGSRLVWVSNVAVFAILLNTVTIEAYPCNDTGGSLNERVKRSLHDIGTDSSAPKSLVFVLDTTASMTDDWRGAVKGAKRIMREFLSYKTRPIKNYILMPFNDPAVGPVTNTENSDIFLDRLNALKVGSTKTNYDCAEMSLTGIIQALEVAYPYSYLYVFTDASAKDYDRVEEALKLIQRKHSQVVFFITGDCGNTHTEDFLVYEKIASASYGQMYYLLRKNVDDVLKSVLITTQPNKSNLLVVSNPVLDPHNSVTFDLSVEKDLKEMIVEVGGASPEVDIKNPLGKKPDKISIPFDLPDNKFIVIDHPEPAGNWVLKVTFHPEKTSGAAKDKTLITVKGIGSAYEIKHGFSVLPVDTLSDTAYRPLEKRENYIFMEVHPTEDTKENRDKLAKFKWENVDVMRSNGKPFFSLPLKPMMPGSGENIFPMRFLAGPFTPPDSLFSLSFRGKDDSKNPVTRLTSNYISAEQASVPFVKMTSLDEFVIGKELKITCEVESLIPFTLQWYKDGNPIGAKKDFPQSSGDSIIMPNAKKEDRGQYKCEATNYRGSDSKDTVVNGIALPLINGMDEGRLIVKEGGSITLKCAVTSDSPYDVQWLRKKGVEEGTLLSPSDAVRIQKDSLSIPSLRNSEVGKYICRASNKAGISEKEVEISMISPPIVDIPTGDLFMYTKGENILIDCMVTASSKTNVHWEFKGAEVGIRKDIYSKETIPFSVPAADKTWEGQYTCVAENEAGKVQKQVESIYVELPLVKAATPYMAVKLDEDATLKCIVSGIPPPVVSWVFGDKLIANGHKYQISPDGSSLKILKADLEDEGTYKCVARGPRDSESTAETKFRIGRPPTAKHLFLNNSIDLEHDGTFPCESDYNPEDVSYPGMKTKISWQRDGSPLDVSRHKVLTSGELKIKAAEVTDEGLYICTLQNAFGETIMRMNLEVNGIDVPFVKMTSLDEFVIGKELKITCEVESLIPFTLQWYKDGIPIGAKKDFPKSSGDTIIMPNAKKEDRGQYKCEATNYRGSDSKDTVVNVIALPQINGMDEGRLIVAEGGSITLKCAVTSDSPYDVQWLRKKGMEEGTLLSPSDAVRIQKDSLSIPSLRNSEVGKYVCRAFNKAGITEKEVEISMIALPIVEIPTGDLIMYTKGENILIDCMVTASSKTNVHWEFKGAEVGIRKDIYSKETIPFSVPAADKTWEGQYICVAENEAGKVQKQVESIYVELPLVKAATPYMSVKLDEDATLKCIVSGIPPPVVSWVFGDKLIANGHKYQISPDGSSLKILKADLEDEGTYKCVARGPRDSESTAETKIRIGRPPTAKHLFLNNSIDLDHDGTFPCESDYNPEDALYPGMKTKISWQREGGPLDVRRHKVLTSGELKIKGAKVTDKGLYICTLQNAFGKTAMKLNLEVKGIVPPMIEDVKPEYVHFKQGANIFLWCNASGVPEPKIIWSYRNDHISDSEVLEDGLDDPGSIKIKGGKLTLYNAISAYEGIFSCVADNGAGTTSPKDYSLRMLVGPPVLADDGKPTKAKVKAGDDYTFNCNTDSSKDLSYKWIKDDKYAIAMNVPGYFTFNKDHSSLTLHSTIPDYHSGYYKCIASNGVGTASKIFSISVGKP